MGQIGEKLLFGIYRDGNFNTLMERIKELQERVRKVVSINSPNIEEIADEYGISKARRVI